jgi:hypothetical protein
VANDNNRERRGPKIESWETLETLVDHKDYFGRMDFGFKVAIEQPIAEGGRRLYKRLNAEIRFGRHFIRLNTKAITTLLRLVDEHREAIDAAVERIHEENDEMRREEQSRRERKRPADRPKPGSPGSGLSAGKASHEEGKTARKRRLKREREQQGQGQES